MEKPRSVNQPIPVIYRKSCCQCTRFYEPSREDTRQELGKLRDIVEHRLGAFRSIVIQGVSDIVLWILKCDDYFNTPDKKRVEVEKLLNPTTDQVFQQMLQIAERITDYSTTQYGDDNEKQITAMEDIVAYNLLIPVYQDVFSIFEIVEREEAYEMLLILKQQSLKPIEAQRGFIGCFSFGHLVHVYCDLLVFLISKLFPEFVRLWDGVALNVINPPPTLEGEGEGDKNVINNLLIFTWGMDNESEARSVAAGPTIPYILRNPSGYVMLRSRLLPKVPPPPESKGFDDNENNLENHGQASAPRDLPDHHQSLLFSRKSGGDGQVVERKSSHEGSQKQQRSKKLTKKQK